MSVTHWQSLESGKQIRRDLRRFVGPPLKESFLNFYGFSEEEGERAVAVYREYFTEKGIKENKLYPGDGKGLQL